MVYATAAHHALLLYDSGTLLDAVTLQTHMFDQVIHSLLVAGRWLAVSTIENLTHEHGVVIISGGIILYI